MDGDFLDIQGFKVLKERFNFFSIVDKAHAASAIDLLEIISQCEKQRKHLSRISSFVKEKLGGRCQKISQYFKRGMWRN